MLVILSSFSSSSTVFVTITPCLSQVSHREPYMPYSVYYQLFNRAIYDRSAVIQIKIRINHGGRRSRCLTRSSVEIVARGLRKGSSASPNVEKNTKISKKVYRRDDTLFYAGFCKRKSVHARINCGASSTTQHYYAVTTVCAYIAMAHNRRQESN
jgi:hypothetical protein